MKSLYNVLESLLDDEDEIGKGVEEKYSIPNLIKNLGNTNDPAKFKEIAGMISDILADHNTKGDVKDKLNNMYFIKAKRLFWSDDIGGRIGLTGARPYQAAILHIKSSESSLRVTRPREMFPFSNGFLFDYESEEYRSFKEALRNTPDVEVYEIPDEYKMELWKIFTYNSWKKFEKI
jgi:hypothetical protein